MAYKISINPTARLDIVETKQQADLKIFKQQLKVFKRIR